MVKQRSIDLGYRPRPWQYECHTSLTRYTVLALHRRAGKTELAIMELLDRAIQAKTSLPLYVYIAPLLKQAKSVVWRRLKARVEPLLLAGLATISESELSVTFTTNQARLQLFGADNPDALRGVALDGAVLDEVSQMGKELWEEVVFPALQDRKGWALFIGTPKGINLFSELYHAAKRADQQALGWSSRVYTVYDTDTFDSEQIEGFRASMTDNAFRREWLCDFSAATEDQVMSLVDIELAATRQPNAQDLAYEPRILGVDPARYGDDGSAIIKRQGRMAFDLQVYRKIDNMALASRVMAIIDEWKPDAVFIDAGNGVGVIDRIRSLGHKVTEVHFGAAAANPVQFANKRAEMWFRCAEWLTTGGCIPNDERLKRGLATPTYDYNTREQKILESKDDLPSPDEADALVLTFAEPVRRQNDPAVPWGQMPDQPIGTFNPYDVLKGAAVRGIRRYNPYRNV